ncbi:TerB family tellurite resistance protein [Gammaproteobacteria bacterium]|nr:TerB family tellurite resistance protein [Gammaproteobacteria bacterium]
MIEAIQNFFKTRIEAKEGDEEKETAARVAAAALLFEAAMSDYQLDDVERQTIKDLITEQFNLDRADAMTLIALAESQAKEATGLHGFTTLINQNWSETERVNLMEKMWRVVYADGRLDDHELHLMRKIQRLLYIPQVDYVAGKLRNKPSTT